MRDLIRFPFYLLLFSSLAICFSTSSCGLFGSEALEVCGKVDYHMESINMEKLTANPPEVKGNQRSYSYSFLLEDMCPEIHIKVYWTCELYEEFHIPPSLHSDVFWGLGPSYEEPVDFSYDRKGLSEFDKIYTAQQEIGLSQAYGTNPAWAIFTFYVTFETLGSQNLDEQYLDSVFNFASALVKYYHLKD